MDSMVCFSFTVGVLYRTGNDDNEKRILTCINCLRSQGFRIQDFGANENADKCLKWADASDAIIIFCTPELKQNGDVLFAADTPGVLEKLQHKTCIPVLVQGDETDSVPEWAKGTVEDYRLYNAPPDCDLYHMGLPLGNILRELELKKLKATVNDEEKKRLCVDCISVFRCKQQRRFILHGRTRETFVRVLGAFGRSIIGVSPLPEWIVYEDPDDFLPESNGEVTVKVSHVGHRDLDVSSENFGAYYLEKPANIQIPERLQYQDRKKLVGIAIKLLQNTNESDDEFEEADPEKLYLMDMEIDIPVPSYNEIHRNNYLHMNEGATARMINFWINDELVI